MTEDGLVDEARPVSRTRVALAGLALLVAYIGLSFLMDPHGYLGTDTGAKVATLQVMADKGTTDPDVGYWAAKEDPTGHLHPLFDSVRRTDGGWVAISTLPMIEAARPLYAAGGYRSALLLPMVGAVAAAFAARSIARRIGASQRDQWLTFWVVGLASPVVIYALDLWEHTLGLALMLWAFSLLLGALDDAPPLPALAAGALLGAGAAMRNEAFVYAAVMVGATCLVQWRVGGSFQRAVRTGLLAIVGFGAVWLASHAADSALGGPERVSRASGTASKAGADLGIRVRESFQTFLGLNSGDAATAALLGAVVVLVVLAAFRAEARGDRRFAIACLVLATAPYLFDAAGGLGFVSGLLLAFPIAIAAFVQLGRRAESRLVGMVALVALPLVWLTQLSGGAAPQWGGRYTLTSAILLGIVGMVGLLDRFPTVGRGLVALSAGVTVLGVAWLGVRSRGADEFFQDVRADAAPVLISRQAFLLREGGPVLLGRTWMSVEDEPSFTDAVDLARSMGADRFSVLEWGGEAPPEASLPDDVNEVNRELLTFVDVPVGLVTYEFTD